jgi:hypothetical protein
METVIKNQKYGENAPFKWLDGYEFCLYRQDWRTLEMVFFNRTESHGILHEIMEGEILIHPNYSILFCKNKEVERIAPDFGCYSILKEDE